jgi:hypothetical protein
MAEISTESELHNVIVGVEMLGEVAQLSKLIWQKISGWRCTGSVQYAGIQTLCLKLLQNPNRPFSVEAQVEIDRLLIESLEVRLTRRSFCIPLGEKDTQIISDLYGSSS